MSQVIGFDFGTHSIGVAVGQTVTGTASPLTALKAKDGQPNWDAVAKLLSDWQPELLVVGLPLNMDGTEQPLTDLARKFANRLHGRFGIKVALQDERLTTVAAKEDLFGRGGYKQLQKGKVDSAAAQLILEDFLSQNS
ncbi:Holliday junction resolvase RuvX [Pseudidiomarina gelatinasegens]|uniref:Putative pre-16S rRNA nuclease n=1 Tax=Pseudidiomarina gelatinasegens TaxID=2487740 RepID=A0A443YY66_9GAMM|nr:Holliday junction resolvase RuvX [Pseudidiomarina gelatinasegens]RWU09034.1 Holliday junction resolvase RuvX [Pseudidiomarina gelatinasegens]